MMRLLNAAMVLLTLFASGCSHYQLGTGSTPSFRSLYLEPVSNQTLVPQAQALLSAHLRQTFSRDTRVASSNSPSNADATLTVVISEFRRDIAAVREGDTGLARKFNLTLGASCTLRDTRSGKNLWENRAIHVTREVFTDSGQLQSEYQSLALLTEALAARIAHAALDTW